MRERLSQLVTGILAGWVGMVTRFPRVIILLAAASLCLVLPFTARNLGINTDTREMFSAELPFRRLDEDFRKNFPQFTDTLLVVVQSDDGQRAFDCAQVLVARCRGQAQFRSVYHAGSEPFLRAHGLLFLETDELQALADDLAPMAPLFNRLGAQPTLSNLAATLALAIPRAFPDGTPKPEPPPALLGLLDGLGQAIDAQHHGRELRWNPTLGSTPGALATTQMVILQPRLDYGSVVPGAEAMARLRELIAEFVSADSDLRIRVTGEVALAADELESAMVGAQRAGLLSLILVTTLLVVGLRSVRMVIAALVTLLIGLAWTAGFAALAVGHLNLISIAFAVLYISLGIDYSIHFCLRYREHVLAGVPSRAAIERVVRDVGRSLVLATITTALGFLAFVPTEFDGVAEMGLIAGMGMVINLIANLTLLPALLSWPPLRPRFASVHPAARAPGARWFEGLVGRTTTVRSAAALVAVLSLLGMTLVRFNPDPIHLRDAGTESVATFRDLAEDALTTPYRLSVLVAPPPGGGAMTAQLTAQLTGLEPVAAAIDLHSFVPTDQEPKRAILATLRRRFTAVASSPGPGIENPAQCRRALAALGQALARVDIQGGPGRDGLQALRSRLEQLGERLDAEPAQQQRPILEAIQRPLLTALLTELVTELGRLTSLLEADSLTVADLPAQFRARWVAPDGRMRVDVLPRENLGDRVALRTFVDAVRTVSTNATGSVAIFYDAGDGAVRSFQQAILYALGAIAMVVFLVMGRPHDVFLVLGPLLLSALMTGAGAALLGIEFNFANIIGLPLLLGIGVDNGIHMVHRYRVAAPADGNILRTSTARAVLFSSLTTLGGFSTLVVSPHPGTASLGALLCLGIGLGLLSTLVVLPALLTPRARAASRVETK